MAVISSQQNSYDEKLFLKSRHSILSVILLLLMALFLIIGDIHYKRLDYVRLALSEIVAPIELTIDYPVRLLGWIHSLVSSKKALVDENMKLRYQQTLLEAQLQKLLVIRNENSQLKELLSATINVNTEAMAAQILAVDTNNSRQLLVINKGKRDGVFPGQPVLDAKGVMGQIVYVGAMTSSVLLITDSKSAVPVQNNRNGERAILVGTNNITYLSLVNLPKTSSISKGDLLVTSGLGRKYPEGYPVGRVEEVINSSGEDFIKVKVSPIALLNRNRLVLLIWPGKEHSILTHEIEKQLNLIDKAMA